MGEEEQPSGSPALSFAQCTALAVVSQVLLLPAGIALADFPEGRAAVGMLGPLTVAAWTLHRWRKPWREMFQGIPAALPQTPWLAAGVVGHLLLLAGLTHGISAVWPWFARSVREIELPVSGRPAAVALLLALGAPFTEELLFRGVLLRGMLARYSVRAAVAGTAVLFAAAHWFPVKVLLMLPAGAALGWLYVRYRTIWPPLLAHALNNGAVAWLLLSAPERPPEPLPTLAWWQGVTMMAMGTVLMWAAYQCLREPPEK